MTAPQQSEHNSIEPPKKPKNKWSAKSLQIFGGFFIQLLIILAIIGVLAGVYGNFAGKQDVTKKVPLSDFVQRIKSDEIIEIEVSSNTLTGKTTTVTKFIATKESGESTGEVLVRYGIDANELSKIPITVKDSASSNIWLGILVPTLLPLLVLGGLIWYMSRQVKGAGVGAMKFGQSRAKVYDPEKNTTTFADVAGNKEAKQELSEVVDFLKYPEKYHAMGAKIPRGVLLTGAPGTGKTLLARAVAGEAKVPFYHLSGSEFVEMFVGVGASRVRDLFELAKSTAPAIVFIDEIDAVGRHRGIGIGGGNDEREQTLNQILVEMDGFEQNEAVIVVAATNRSDVLDEALLRPGRFDRRVVLDIPDRQDRHEILKIHAKNKKLTDDVNLERVAVLTPGFSGADIDLLINESAILAARENKTEISQRNIVQSIDKVLMGPERTSYLHSPKEREIVAYHEAGHALLSTVLPDADPVQKITIVARGHAGGYTMNLPDEEKKLLNTAEYRAQLAVLMGGFAAELVQFGDTTTGPSNDIQVATNLAKNMVTKWGMSETVGPIALVGPEGRYTFVGGDSPDKHGQNIQNGADEAIKKLISEALDTAKNTLKRHKSALDAIANALLRDETLEREEYETVVENSGIPLKNKEKIDKTETLDK